MKILQLCHKPPNPPKDGGCIAMNNISEGLIRQGHDLKVLTIHTHKHNFEAENLDENYLSSTRIESVFVDTKINLVDAFSSLITQDSYNISRFFSADFDIKLQEVLQAENFDVVLLESLFMTPYIDTIRRFSEGKVVLRSHNLEYIIWERVAHGSRNPAKKSYLRLLAKQLKNYELKIFSEVDGIVAISNSDEQKYIGLGFKGPITTIPFGLDTDRIKYHRSETSELTFFHLGSMDWTPNLEGVTWFLDEVWSLVQKKSMNLKLYLAGRRMPEEIKQRNDKNVVVVGEVADAYDFMNEHAVMVVPLLSAGGIRVKIIEGMAIGKTIISTSIGAEGIDYENGKHLFIANTPKEFVRVIEHLVQHRETIDQVGADARKLVCEKFDNQVLTGALIEFFRQLKKR